MAVVCACIPSLRPLYTIFTQGVFDHPLVKTTLHPASSTSSKRMWRASKSKPSDGTFSQLEDSSQDLRALEYGAYDASVRAGRSNSDQQERDTTELPDHGIKVRTEVTLTSSNRLDWNDRLY